MNAVLFDPNTCELLAGVHKNEGAPASLFINGEWVAAQSGRTYQNVNPADTREVVAEYPLSDQADAVAAIDAAKRAFPGWAATTPVAPIPWDM